MQRGNLSESEEFFLLEMFFSSNTSGNAFQYHFFFFAHPRAAPNIYCTVGGRFFGELRHLLLHSILVELRWILLERAFIWIHYWHVSCAIYYGHNMGRFPAHLELRHLFSVARMAKRHAPHTEKLLKFTYVLRRLNIYSPLLRENRWLRCVR